MIIKWVEKKSLVLDINEIQKHSPETCVFLPCWDNQEKISKYNQETKKREVLTIDNPMVKVYHPNFKLIKFFPKEDTFHYPTQLRGNFDIILELNEAVQEIRTEVYSEYEIWKTEQECKKETNK